MFVTLIPRKSGKYVTWVTVLVNTIVQFYLPISNIWRGTCKRGCRQQNIAKFPKFVYVPLTLSIHTKDRWDQFDRVVEHADFVSWLFFVMLRYQFFNFDTISNIDTIFIKYRDRY